MGRTKAKKIIGEDGKIKYICNRCGKVYVPNNYWNSKHWCTNKCRIKHKDEMREEALRKRRLAREGNPTIQYEQRECAFCGSPFTWQSNKPTQKYCSKECQKEAQKERYRKRKKWIKTPSDEMALEELVRDLVKTLNYYNGLSNSAQCFFTDHFTLDPKIRKEVLERDGHRCRVCGRTTNLHIHHIRKRRDGGSNDVWNLITLCPGCHRAIETGDTEHAIKKCKKRWKNPIDGNGSDLDYVQKAKDAKKELEKLYNILANDGEACGVTSIKICIDNILDKVE